MLLWEVLVCDDVLPSALEVTVGVSTCNGCIRARQFPALRCQPCLCFVFWHHRMHSGGMSLVKLWTCPVALTCPVVAALSSPL